MPRTSPIAFALKALALAARRSDRLLTRNSSLVYSACHESRTEVAVDESTHSLVVQGPQGQDHSRRAVVLVTVTTSIRILVIYTCRFSCQAERAIGLCSSTASTNTHDQYQKTSCNLPLPRSVCSGAIVASMAANAGSLKSCPAIRPPCRPAVYTAVPDPGPKRNPIWAQRAA